MKFISLVEFDGTISNAYGTDGACFLARVDQIAGVKVEVERSDHTSEPTYKWLTITYVDGETQGVCPLGESGQAMAPTAIRDESDALIARWAATALEES